MSERHSRLAFGAVSAAYVVVLLWLAAILPERVPMHFDAAGNADAWDGKAASLAFWGVLGVVMLGGGALLARFATGGSGVWVNLPHKDYWLAPERRAAFRRRFEADMLGFVAWTGGLLVVMMLIGARAALNDGSAPGWWIWSALGVYIVGTVAWSWWMMRRYRPPTG